MPENQDRVEKNHQAELRLTLGSDRPEKSSSKQNIEDAKVERLIDLIGNEQYSIRMAATKKLSDLGERAVPALLTALQNGLWYTRECAVQALGSIASSKAIESLLSSLRDENVGVRRAAARALCNMVEQEMLSQVAEVIVQNDQMTQREILEALRKASPLAWRELNGILGRHVEPSRGEAEKSLVEKAPAEEAGLPSERDRGGLSVWERLRRFLETRS